jgi:DNA-binding NarL/FixJ family response regulator
MINVLIADDQQLLRDLMKFLLSADSEISVVGCAEDGNQAVEMAENLHPDLILMDIIMPNCNGIEATKIIKQKHRNIKILILTTSDDSEDIHEALKNGADGYVLKNIGDKSLVHSIKSVIADIDVIHRDVNEIIRKKGSRAPYKLMDRTVVMNNGVKIELTERDLKVIGMIVEGKSTNDMSAELFVSEGRMRNIITGIVSKLMMNDRTQVAVFALKNKLI